MTHSKPIKQPTTHHSKLSFCKAGRHDTRACAIFRSTHARGRIRRCTSSGSKKLETSLGMQCSKTLTFACLHSSVKQVRTMCMAGKRFGSARNTTVSIDDLRCCTPHVIRIRVRSRLEGICVTCGASYTDHSVLDQGTFSSVGRGAIAASRQEGQQSSVKQDFSLQGCSFRSPILVQVHREMLLLSAGRCPTT